MQKKISGSIVLTIVVLTGSGSYAQSGVASLQSFVSSLRDLRHPAITLDYLYGTSGSSDKINYNALQVSASATILGATHIWASIPLRQQDGPLGSVSGVGDLTLVINQGLLNLAGLDFSLDLGTKLATGSVTKGTFPQAYQNGTGTNDWIFGLNIMSSAIDLGVGYELVGGRSWNEITRLKSGDDFIMHAGYTNRGESFDLGGELIGIWQLQQSTALNPISQTGDFIAVAGSSGILFDALIKAQYRLGSMVALNGSLGIPLNKKADDNIDGLSRGVTASAGIGISF